MDIWNQVWKKYWKLLVLRDIPTYYIENKRIWRKVFVKCECWKEKMIFLYALRNLKTTSCWCDRVKLNNNYKNWLKNNPLYGIYIGIRYRCNNNKSKKYYRYGWRWIKCEWKSFEEFYKDMFPTYKKWLSIDRIDNNWNYCKENCRWATKMEQAWNTSRVIIPWWLAKYCRDNNLDYLKEIYKYQKLWREYLESIL